MYSQYSNIHKEICLVVYTSHKQRIWLGPIAVHPAVAWYGTIHVQPSRTVVLSVVLRWYYVLLPLLAAADSARSSVQLSKTNVTRQMKSGRAGGKTGIAWN